MVRGCSLTAVQKANRQEDHRMAAHSHPLLWRKRSAAIFLFIYWPICAYFSSASPWEDFKEVTDAGEAAG